MIRRLLALVLVVLAMSGCASGDYSSAPPTASAPPRTRCLVNPNEAGTRPLVFLFCVESP
jgi:hypothetical protein